VFSKGFEGLALIESALSATESIAIGIAGAGSAKGAGGAAACVGCEASVGAGISGAGFFLKNENMETFYNHSIL
jgi:hypothetical protein